ncbi:ricin-type beta-trefoil lectin domain protein [Streptomyces sp. DSM 41634]|uniref:ricin-type beta-trefoil lectin domain protein n=1 Tax=Streptomyces sp. DSM 41634 TaxID=3448656 RepID=UPI00288442AB|nr:ricin-type beta-trefoil lectin domain protein [Streptomyces sp. DSM 41633]
MGRPGRPPGPLKGRTSEANALAQFLRELTAEYTVSQLEARYGGSRSVWSEYRSGQKIIPLSRLKQIIEDRYARDARTRDHKLQEARRLYIAAKTAAAGTAASEAPPAPDPAVSPATSQTGSTTPATEDAPPPALEHEANGPLADGAADSSADNSRTSTDTARAPATDTPAPEEASRPDAKEPLVSPPPPEPGTRPGGRAARYGRWRIPAQWAALAALVTVLVIANRPDHAKAPSTEASSPQDLGQDRQSSAPVDPDSSPTVSQTPDASAPTFGPTDQPAAPPPSQAPAPAQPDPSKNPQPADSTPAGAPLASFFQRTLRNVTTGKCLDINAEGIPNQGHRLTQFDCGAGSGHKQAFDLVDGVDGFLIRSSDQPRLCLDLGDLEAPTNPSYVGLYPCQNTTGDNQLWYRKWNADQSAFLLVNAKSEHAGRPMCLDVDDYSAKTNGKRVGLFPCNYTSSDDHWWTLP